MTDRKQPMAEANRISSMLNMVLGANRFPVKVDEVALEYSRQCFADSPVDKVHGEDLDGLEGMLATNKARSKWLIVYNSAIRSEGRHRPIRDTVYNWIARNRYRWFGQRESCMLPRPEWKARFL